MGTFVYYISGYLIGEVDEYEQVARPHDEPSGAKEEKESDGPEADRVKDRVEGEEDDVNVPNELPENAIFIPLWWGKKRPPEFFKGSDPEWQGYVKFSMDLAKVEDVKCKSRHVEA